MQEALHFVTEPDLFRHVNVVTKPTKKRYESQVARGRSRKYHTNADRQRAYRQRRKRSVHFSSETDVWSTPDELFATLDAKFQFTCDVCADDTNAKCPRDYTQEMDGLKQRWEGVGARQSLGRHEFWRALPECFGLATGDDRAT